MMTDTSIYSDNMDIDESNPKIVDMPIITPSATEMIVDHSMEATSIQQQQQQYVHGNNNNPHIKRRSRVIKWDEETIAEHDKERGTRQRIDEPPTPYRYHSESETDQSEAESELSDKSAFSEPEDMVIATSSASSATTSAHLTSSSAFVPSQISKDLRKNRNSPSIKKKKTISFSPVDSLPVTSTTKHAVMSDWSELQAKLHYHQFLQDNQSDEKVYDDNTMTEPEAEALEEHEEGRSMLEPAGALRFNPSATFMEAEEAKATDFALRRAAHYNEFKVIQALRSRTFHQDDNDEDDDIHDDDEKMEGGY